VLPLLTSLLLTFRRPDRANAWSIPTRTLCYHRDIESGTKTPIVMWVELRGGSTNPQALNRTRPPMHAGRSYSTSRVESAKGNVGTRISYELAGTILISSTTRKARRWNPDSRGGGRRPEDWADPLLWQVMRGDLFGIYRQLLSWRLWTALLGHNGNIVRVDRRHVGNHSAPLVLSAFITLACLIMAIPLRICWRLCR
jgi:hypothetical protein